MKNQKDAISVNLFGPPDAYRLALEERCACGQAAAAAAAGVTVQEILPAFPGPFLWVDDRRMQQALAALGILRQGEPGEMAVEWLQGLGSWMNPKIHVGARNQRTHWIATCGQAVYDLNADSWLPRAAWEQIFLPEFLQKWEASGVQVRSRFYVGKGIENPET